MTPMGTAVVSTNRRIVVVVIPMGTAVVSTNRRGRRDGDCMVPMQSVPITINVVSLNPTQAKQHYVIKFVSDLQQVGTVKHRCLELGWVEYYGWLELI